MITFQLDGQSCSTRADINLLQACLEAGANLPYFCWHPELGSVGACRQCAVKQFSGPEDKTGRIVMACMTPATEGALISIDDAEAKEFREGVIEWMMVNHPHDCPVCPEGGECHLQDMTVMAGHNTRRYRFTKRTHRNQDLGPFIKHEMNRCIACYRCVRFYRDYAGGDDLAVLGAHDNVYFGRAEDGTLENAFSGNLVELCPTGVFTDKPFSETYTRKWDLRGAPSVCVHCAVGCNTFVNAREEKVRRLLNRYNDEVNRYVLCDRGRFGHGFVNAASRLNTPLCLSDEQPTPVPTQAAMAQFARMAASGPIAGITSSRASLETCFSLRSLVGPDLFSTGQTQQEQTCTELAYALLRDHPGAIPTLHEMESADAVLILGEDASTTAPRLALAVRQSGRQNAFLAADAAKVPRWMDAAVRTIGSETLSSLFIVSPAPTDLDGIARDAIRAVPDNAARLGFAIWHELDPTAPTVPDLKETEAEQANRIATVLAAAKKPLVVSGMQYGSIALMQAAAGIARALTRNTSEAGLSLVLPDCNSMGLAMMGGAPLETIMARAKAGAIGTLIIIENDLTRRLDPPEIVDLLEAVPNIVLIDHTATPLWQNANLVLPAATFSEDTGTLISQEGRAQRFFPAVFPPAPIQASWRWVQDLARALPSKQGTPASPASTNLSEWKNLDEVIADLGKELPVFAKIINAAPDASYRLNGQKLRSQTYRASGRTVIRSYISVRDQPPPTNPDTPFSSSMEGAYRTDMPAALVPHLHAPAWNSVQALNRFQQGIGGPLRGGEAGIRLFSSATAEGKDRVQPSSAPDIPPPFIPQPDTVLLLPEARLFGGEELSMFSPPVAARAPPPDLRLPTSAALQPRMTLHLKGYGPETLPMRHLAGLPDGVALCPPHMVAGAFRFPQIVRLTPDPAEGEET
ncbi:NADH-quinone oxidoreductase subunit NuoG [Acetobacter tropicalis]|uniref:NADH-quinone oxidoreductase subunit G n=1 Tax=Acetobacter tropicalis TaxID=104102 RepID=A0A095AW81_9PROT|nr:NADH-quinone oxidoreductase subunit NuoG [Acetobacter tropicalis]KAA8383568.1 NADH-quinone oxidoreductase subunit NuoG [Acetobacter tropicalis]KAA8389351.1 NADH-quinone oxidoreductase subunit NuoG [Acetobacter tropicalis]KGB21043.1 NADH-ubiquinone oxidoreductase chain G [Acetobacter tropicalis]MBC9008688.1 NADH-quinone oxidoreductase subunit NuoG [Acetobacter tropicalis]MDO8173027.1 NADH-quinone oxidoreductase subunit NuoG [Acetobacter tropicalis]